MGRDRTIEPAICREAAPHQVKRMLAISFSLYVLTTQRCQRLIEIHAHIERPFTHE